MHKLKKRPDGRYQKKIRLSDGKVKIVYGRTLAELAEASETAILQDRQGIAVGDHTTVGEWAKIWLKQYKSELRPNTIRMYKDAYNLHIMQHIGGMELQDVRPVHVRAVMQSVADQSDSLQHKVKLTMTQIFQSALENGLIASNPAAGARITHHTRPSGKKKYLTREEAAELMFRIDDPRAKAFAGLCLYCGLRREEALGLQWVDIDMSGASLTVNRAVTFVGNRPDPSFELKSRYAHRTIPIPQPMLEILMYLKRKSLWVIPNKDGDAMTSSGYQRLWEKVSAASPVPVHAHMLRHTYATMLYHSGVDVRKAQKLLGHSSIQLTADIYTHVEQDDNSAAIVLLDGYLSGKKEVQQNVLAT